MKQVLADIHLAEAYSQGLGDSTRNRFDKNYDSLAGFYSSILKHYDLSFEDFNEAIAWYKKRPVMMDSLYAKVLTQLMEIKSRAGLKDIETLPAQGPPPSAGAGGYTGDTLTQGNKNQLLSKLPDSLLQLKNEERRKQEKEKKEQSKIKEEP